MLRTADLDYELPPERIATEPARPRDSARLLVTRRSVGARLEHRTVSDLPALLRPGDLLVFNTTRVLPARFLGVRQDTGGRVEGLFLHRGPGEGTWEVLLKARRFRDGAPILVCDEAGRPVPIRGSDGRLGAARLTLVERVAGDGGGWIVRAELVGDGWELPIGPGETLIVLGQAGRTPIPPYIRAARKQAGLAVPEQADRERYQTVYASAAGSIAAPTAGLHFTPGLLARLEEAGARRADVVLHVGMGTFKPVESEYIEEHPMHAEWCTMPGATAGTIRAARAAGGRVIAVGTTSARTIEAYAALGDPVPESITTRLLITPGYEWRWVDGILTNFHLPRSTLMAMVGALLPGGVGALRGVYAEAIARGYRFYSYGDAMLILP